MVRRRSSLMRVASHSTTDQRESVVNGIRASFVAPRDRHAAILALNRLDEALPPEHRTSTISRPTTGFVLTNLYNSNEFVRPRYSWVKDSSFKAPRPSFFGDTIDEVSTEFDSLLKGRKSDILTVLETDEDSLRDSFDVNAALGLDGYKFEPISKAQVWLARFYIILSAALYGTSFPIIKILDDNLPVNINLVFRFFFASLVTLPLLLEAPAINWNSSLSACLRAIELGMWDMLGFFGQTLGMLTTPANKSAFICSLDVVVVPFLDRLVGIPLAAAQLMAAGLSVCGVGFLSLEGSSISFSLGDMWSFSQPVCFGIGFWRTEHAIEKYPDEVNRITAAQLLFCFAFSLLYTIISYAVGHDSAPTAEQFVEWFSNPVIIFALLWTGIVCTALTLYLETLAMKSISAAETTLLISSEPLWAALFAWMLVGENLGITGAVGGMFIVGACVVSMW